MKGAVAVETFGRADMLVPPATETNSVAHAISFADVPDSTSSHSPLKSP